MKALFATLSLFVAVGCAKAPNAAISMCAVLSSPMDYDGKEVVLSGWMSLAFEDFAIVCRPSSEKSPLRSVWIDFDLRSIEKKSPLFLAQVKSDIQKAIHGGGAKREVVVRATLQFSKEALSGSEKPFSGFGHLGMSSGQVTVTEVLKYGPNKAPEPTP